MSIQFHSDDHLFGGTETPAQDLGGDLALDADGVVRIGDSWQFRTGYTAASLFCMLLLALMLGSRAKHLHFNNVKAMNFMRFLVIVLYISAIVFVAAAALLEIGAGINSPAICSAGSSMCVAFYIVNKVLMYTFMVERAHSIRAPYTRRIKDFVWITWMLILGVGFTLLVVLAFILKTEGISPEDDKCRIGLPRKVSITLVIFDTWINFMLTAVFIWLLRPLLAFHRTSDPEARSFFRLWLGNKFSIVGKWIPFKLPYSSGPYHQTVNQSLVRAVEWLVWKTLAGTVLVVIPTIANLTLLTVMGGHEQAWLCFTLCTGDVTWAVSVVHWLTVDPLEVDNRPTTCATFDSSTSERCDTEMSDKVAIPIEPSHDVSSMVAFDETK